MKLDMLFAHCADLGLDVEWADLGGVRRGEYRHGDRLIVLNHRLTRSQAIAALAHELGHHTFGDTCSTPAVERRASEYGAALVISPSEYATAEAIVGCHPGAIALELGVTRHLVEAWRRWFLRRWPLELRNVSGHAEHVESSISIRERLREHPSR